MPTCGCQICADIYKQAYPDTVIVTEVPTLKVEVAA
jgi:hypothetical protein